MLSNLELHKIELQPRSEKAGTCQKVSSRCCLGFCTPSCHQAEAWVEQQKVQADLQHDPRSELLLQEQPGATGDFHAQNETCSNNT